MRAFPGRRKKPRTDNTWVRFRKSQPRQTASLKCCSSSKVMGANLPPEVKDWPESHSVESWAATRARRGIGY
jgi:hypothetical protein